jgi:hypothetical protein
VFADSAEKSNGIFFKSHYYGYIARATSSVFGDFATNEEKPAKQEKQHYSSNSVGLYVVLDTRYHPKSEVEYIA